MSGLIEDNWILIYVSAASVAILHVMQPLENTVLRNREGRKGK